MSATAGERVEEDGMITRMRTGDKEHIKRVHNFYCIGVRAGGDGMGWDRMEGCVLRMYYCILFVAREAYISAESADSIAIPIHCVASGTRSTACL